MDFLRKTTIREGKVHANNEINCNVLEQVSRLLAAVYVLSTSVKSFALPSSKVISERHWASFFHQASIGAHFNLQLFSTLMKHRNDLNLLDSEVYFSVQVLDFQLWNSHVRALDNIPS